MTQPSSSAPDRYRSSPAAPILASAVLGAGGLAVAWWIHSAAQNGGIVSAPEDAAATRAIAYAIAGAAALFALVFLLRIPVILTRRLEIDRDGVRWRGAHVPWEQVSAVRVLVLTTTKPAATSPTPRSVRTTTRMSLELAVREPALAEGHQPSLTRLRIPGADAGGFTHHIQLGPGPLLANPQRKDFAPEVQGVLERVAAPMYRGVSVRQTTTTWTR